MHNIIVKEQYTYEPADWVTTYVYGYLSILNFSAI